MDLIIFWLILGLLILLLVSPLIVGAVLLAKKRVKKGRIVIGIYSMCVVMFVIYAEVNHRSTSGHVFRFFKGEDGSHQRVNDLAEDAKKSVDPMELQRWAVTILQETPTNSDDDELPRDKVPSSIQNLKSSDMEFEDVEPDRRQSVPVQERSVWIVWGGGFGHWGMRVGSPAFKPGSAYDDNYYIEWKPGVYFWCETH